MMVMCNVDHVVCINSAEWSEAVSYNGKKGDQDVVDNVDDILLLSIVTDPACIDCVSLKRE